MKIIWFGKKKHETVDQFITRKLAAHEAWQNRKTAQLVREILTDQSVEKLCT